MNLILASQSPRRRELLGLFGRPFTVRAADIDEKMQGDPFREVARVSKAKADATAREMDDIVIAADTIVVCDGVILGKPRDEADAVRMLTMLSGRTHQVMTGVTVQQGNSSISHTEVTDVTFRSLAVWEIEGYVRSGEPMDKAGAYGIQGGAALFVEGIRGDYFNVVGLPVCALGQMLRKLNPAWMEENG